MVTDFTATCLCFIYSCLPLISYLSVYLFLFAYPFIDVSDNLSVSVYRSICQFICLSISLYISLCPPIITYIYNLPVYQYLYQYIIIQSILLSSHGHIYNDGSRIININKFPNSNFRPRLPLEQLSLLHIHGPMTRHSQSRMVLAQLHGAFSTNKNKLLSMVRQFSLSLICCKLLFCFVLVNQNIN